MAVKCGNKSDHANELMRFRYIQTYVDEGVDVLTLSRAYCLQENPSLIA